jgi:hypothetical protein
MFFTLLCNDATQVLLPLSKSNRPKWSNKVFSGAAITWRHQRSSPGKVGAIYITKEPCRLCAFSLSSCQPHRQEVQEANHGGPSTGAGARFNQRSYPDKKVEPKAKRKQAK